MQRVRVLCLLCPSPLVPARYDSDLYVCQEDRARQLGIND
jgi:hypothetical protein